MSGGVPDASPHTTTATATDDDHDEVLHWAYMMVNYEHRQKINTFIGNSTQPACSVRLHNGGMAGGAKSTKAAAGSWKLQMIVGPLPDECYANKCASYWRHSRGIPSRCERGKKIARILGLTCWDRNKRNAPDPAMPPLVTAPDPAMPPLVTAPAPARPRARKRQKRGPAAS